MRTLGTVQSSAARPGIALLAALVLVVLVLLALPAAGQQEASLPDHPSELEFPPLDFEPPSRDAYRHELDGGVPVYVVEDHELPLVSVRVLVRTGDYTEPAVAKPGLAALTGSQMRAGGTASLTASEFDEEVDFLAAQIGSFVGDTQGGANMNCLTKDLDRCLELFFEMLRQPRFQDDRLELAKSQRLQRMERRNDSTSSIEQREWSRLIYGTDHFSTVAPTETDIEGITRDDLIAFHEFAFHPGNFVFAVSGDVTAEEILPRLERAMTGWEAGPEPRPVPEPRHSLQPGLYLVHKEDVNQGRVSIGHLATTRDDPNRHALQVMNDILGGGGFTSRIMSRVRSDEGLAYSAGSQFSLGTHYDGPFRAFFQSRSAAVARATQIVLDEIERIRTAPVTADELADSKASFVETFTRNFSSAGQIAGLFASDELTGRDPAYLAEYRDAIRAVSPEDVQRVAREYLHPDRLVILVVGNTDDILAGDPDFPEASLEAMAPDDRVVRIPLPDPMTMEYPDPQQ